MADPAHTSDPAIPGSDAALLLDLAEVAIRAGLDGTHYPGPDVELLPESLRRPCGAFVSLHVAGRLNGCIGNLAGDGPIGTCVGELAIKAAFEDPRLPPLRRGDLRRLEIEVSLLSPRTPVPAATRDVLLDQLIPFEQGLVLADERRQGVFLPTVWEQLPAPDDFVDRLLAKAGIAADPWPTEIEAEVFTTAVVSRRLG